MMNDETKTPATTYSLRTLPVLQANGQQETLEVYDCAMKTGIRRTEGFEHKGLAMYSVNCGIKCGHGCVYCSSDEVLRKHRFFKAAGVSSSGKGFAVVDKGIVDRVARDAISKRKPGMIQLGTTVDLWAPEAKEHELGRRCMEAILAESDWTIRVLTKGACVREDFDLMEQHRNRVMFGMSLTAASRFEPMVNLVEPAAAPLSERFAVMREAHDRGLRTYGMFCPLIAGLGAMDNDVEELFQFALANGCEEVFAENLNDRDHAMEKVEVALRQGGFDYEADRVKEAAQNPGYTHYVASLVMKVQRAARKSGLIEKLNFLLYEKYLEPWARETLKRDPAGIRWLNKKVEINDETQEELQ